MLMVGSSSSRSGELEHVNFHRPERSERSIALDAPIRSNAKWRSSGTAYQTRERVAPRRDGAIGRGDGHATQWSAAEVGDHQHDAITRAPEVCRHGVVARGQRHELAGA